jgi:hypothetical protein
MTFQEFKMSLELSEPPKNISQNLMALWYDAKGDWDRAHQIVQETGEFDGEWIHAYLHRKEGDLGNASYWYRRVGKLRPNISLDDEWEQLAKYLLTSTGEPG